MVVASIFKQFLHTVALFWQTNERLSLVGNQKDIQVSLSYIKL